MAKDASKLVTKLRYINVH